MYHGSTGYGDGAFCETEPEPSFFQQANASQDSEGKPKPG